MWQLFELGALFTSAAQDVTDKFAIVRTHSIDTSVASFYRTVLFLLATIIIGLLGLLGNLQFFFYWQVLFFAPLCVISSLLWTYLLRNVEVLTISAAFYLAPLLYLVVDTHLLAMHLTASQVMGVLLLVAGGMLFSIDGETYRFKRELTRGVWAALGLTVLYNGAEAYFFKYLNSNYNVNGVSFYASLWSLSAIGLLAIVLVQRKAPMLVDKNSRAYVPQVAVSKSCDAASSVLSAQALTFAAVSQVTAFDALYPLISFVFVVTAQGIFRLRLNERLQVRQFLWKTVGIVLLLAGSVLVT